MATTDKQGRKGGADGTEGGLLAQVWDILKTVFWALLIAAAFRSFLFQPFSIPSGSMKPTLLVGDYLFVTKYSYGYSNFSFPFAPDLFEGRIWSTMPQRGDVVVFKHPRRDACSEGPITTVSNFVTSIVSRRVVGANDCEDFVKRVVGLPGDRVAVIDGVPHVNGEPLKTERIVDFVEIKREMGSPPQMPNCINDPVATGGACLKEQYRETFPGGTPVHNVLNIQGTVGSAGSGSRSQADNMPERVVPAGEYFFMGDNRDNSRDSRFPSVGMVPFENLIGRADVIVVSSEGSFLEFWKWRGDRFFKSIE